MSLPVTLFRGRGHLKVLVENTPGAWGAGTLRLAAVRGAQSQRGWLLSRRGRHLAMGVSLRVTLFGGRGHLKVLVENTPGAWGVGTLRLAAVRGAQSQRGWLLSRRAQGRPHVPAVPPAFAYSPEEHPERLAWNKASGLRLGWGAGLDGVGDRSA